MHINPGPSGGVTVYFRDISERRRSEEQIRFQAHLLNAVEEAVVATDLDGKILFWNRFAETLYGWASEEVVGRDILELTSASDPNKAQLVMARLREGGSWSGEFTGRRRDGSTFPGHVTDSPVHDQSGQLIGIVGVSYDITQRKRWEEHQRLLLNELNHRVKNTLTTVQSIVTQTLRNAASPTDARHAVEQRLIGLSRAHDVLTRENWDGAQISEVIGQAVSPFLSDGQTQFLCRGPEVRLQPRVALALAMAFQELVTNAVKYGALSNEAGEIHVSWLVDHTSAEPQLFLRWEERGGPPVSAPTRRGFGSRLIERSLAADLGGAVRMEFAPAGLVCTVDAPLGMDAGSL